MLLIRPHLAVNATHEPSPNFLHDCEAQPPQSHLAREVIGQSISELEQTLRQQNDRLEDALWSTHVKAAEIRDELDDAQGASSSYLTSAYDQIRRLVVWIGAPVAVALGSIAALLAFPGTRRWLGNVQSIEAAGVSINVRDPASVREGVHERFEEVDKAISATYIQKLKDVDMDQIFGRLKTAIDHQFQSKLGLDVGGIAHRATLWVPGFPGWELVQATRYFGVPEPGNVNVVGRRFSVRYGIIGRAWRLRATQYNWDVNNDADALIRNWGLTLREARKQQTHSMSLMAFVIPNDEPDGDPLGVVYLEAAGVNALMPMVQVDELEKLVAADAHGRRVADIQAYTDIWEPILKTDAAKHLTGALINLRRTFNWDLKIVSSDGR